MNREQIKSYRQQIDNNKNKNMDSNINSSKAVTTKPKTRTLCTIDTSDIDLQQIKGKAYVRNPKTNKSKSKSKNKNNRYYFQQQHNNYEQQGNDIQSNTNNMSRYKQKNKNNKNKREIQNIITTPTNVKKSSMNKQNGSYFTRNITNININMTPNPNLNQDKKRQLSRKRSHSHSNWNKTMTRQRSRIKTQYSTFNDIAFKSLLSKSKKTIKDKLLASNPLQQTYSMDTYEIIQQLHSSTKQQRHYLCRRYNKLYILKKTKSAKLKAQFQNQLQLNKIKNTKSVKKHSYSSSQSYNSHNSHHNSNNIYTNNTTTISHNVEKLHKMYTIKNYLYAIYEYNGSYLSWNNELHQKMIKKMIKDEAAMLRYTIKQIAKGIDELSIRGYIHGRIRLDTISMHVQQYRNVIQMQGNIKLCHLHKCINMMQNKQHLLQLPQSIYTAPQIINLKLFQMNNSSSSKTMTMGSNNTTHFNFDRQLLDYISYYDEPWYVDVWALGVLMLELIAGEEISIEKVGNKQQNQENQENQDIYGQEQKYNNKSKQNTSNNQQQFKDISNQHQVSIKIESQHDQTNVITKNKKLNKNFHQSIRKSGLINHGSNNELSNDKNNKKRIKNKNKNQQKFEQTCEQQDNSISLNDILEAQKSLLFQTETQIEQIGFDKKLQTLLIRMLSINPLDRPSPKQIIRTL